MVSLALLFQPFFSYSCYLSRVPKKRVASILSRSVMELRGNRMCLRGPVVRTDVTVKATVRYLVARSIRKLATRKRNQRFW